MKQSMLATNPETGRYPIKHHGSTSTSIAVQMGPYKTSKFGHYTGMRLGKSPVIQCSNDVSFAKNRLVYEYDIENLNGGPPVKVQVGHESTGETTKLLGMFEREKRGGLLGTVARNGKMIGQFKVIGAVSTGYIKTPKVGEPTPLWEVSTPAGVIQNCARFVPAKGSAMQKFLTGHGSVMTDCRIDDRVVAQRTRDGIWFADELSDDSRMCVVAMEAVQVLFERTDESSQDAAQLNNSVIRLTR